MVVWIFENTEVLDNGKAKVKLFDRRVYNKEQMLKYFAPKKDEEAIREKIWYLQARRKGVDEFLRIDKLMTHLYFEDTGEKGEEEWRKNI